ncbi:MAG: hypothetical protein B7X54_06155 [Idiomarina sp. 34-48-12]|nr:MAG: hypothetical protein B7X54_06155 [Idiomarina sp. 34-48-12]
MRKRFQPFQQFNHDFGIALVDVFGFDFDTAAAHFGVTKRTVYNWYDNNKAPRYIMVHLDIISRGYLPAYFPFDEWRIVGTDIHTPYGVISAFEVEFTKRFMWLAREATAQLQNKRMANEEMRLTVERILGEADKLQMLYKQAK